MKRILYCFLICILTCAIGCKKENADFIPIVSNEPDTVEVVEPGHAQPTQIEENKPKETIKEETTSDNKFGYSLKRDSIKIEDKTGDDK